MIVNMPAKAALISVKSAYEKKLIKLEIKGAAKKEGETFISGHYGKCLEINITNLTNSPLNLTLETGRKLICDNDSTQDMLVTQSLIFVLNGKSSDNQKIYAMCIAKNKISPSGKSKFKIGNMAENYLLQLALLIEKYAYQDCAGQNAIWALIAKHDSSDIWCTDNYIERTALRRFVTYANAGNFIHESMLFNKAVVPIIEQSECYITGEIRWEMQTKGFVTLSVYDEKENFISDIFVQKEYNGGNRYCNFKVVSCLIKPYEKYIVRLKIKNETVKELACVAIK